MKLLTRIKVCIPHFVYFYKWLIDVVDVDDGRPACSPAADASPWLQCHDQYLRGLRF